MSIAVYQKDNTAPIVIPTWKVPFLYAYSFLWNLARKPFVALWKAQIENIYAELHSDIERSLLPELNANARLGCATCRDMHQFFKYQIYTSQIKTGLLQAFCREHATAYKAFAYVREPLFRMSHDLSDKVCGFKSTYR